MENLYYFILALAAMAVSFVMGWFVAVNGLISDRAWHSLNNSGNAIYIRLFRMMQTHFQIMLRRMRYGDQIYAEEDKA